MWVRLAKLPSGKFRKTKLYCCWTNMKYRCLNRSALYYHRYGGRGILIYPPWRRSFGTFRAWAIRNGVAKGLTLDRIDNDGHYEPDNCQWITQSMQNRNRSITTLNEDSVAAIRKSTAEPEVLAERYGVTPAHVACIRSGRRWPELPPPNGGSDR